MFSKGATTSIPSFFFVQFQFLSRDNEICFCWRLNCILQCSTNVFVLAKMVRFTSFSVSFCFLLFSKNPAFQYLSLALKKFLHLQVKHLPVLVISKAWIVLQTLRGSSPNVCWHSFLRITGIEFARKAYIFSFSWRKFYSWENCCNNTPQPWWMDDCKYFEDYEFNQWKFKSTQKRETIPEFLGRKVWRFYGKKGFWITPVAFIKLRYYLGNLL